MLCLRTLGKTSALNWLMGGKDSFIMNFCIPTTVRGVYNAKAMFKRYVGLMKS